MVDPITSVPKLDEMCKFLETGPDGFVVEVGVFEGGSIRHMAEKMPQRQFYGYDTFTGMPPTSSFDNFHKAGDFTADIETVYRNLAHVSNVTLIKGFYPQSDNVKPCPIALAHVDVDLYESTYQAFCHLAPLMAKGGRVYCDDAFFVCCEGATLALCRFCHETSMIPKTSTLYGQPFTYLEF